MVCIGISNEKAKIYLSYNKFVIETMDNQPIDTIDLSAKYVRVNNLSINGDISNEQLYELDASMLQIFQQAYDDDQSFCNLDVTCDFSLAGTFFGPETLIIDPYSYGDNSGTVVIKGNLQVLGEHTFINSQTIEVSDNIIRMHANYNSLDFGGIEVVDNSGVLRQLLWSNVEDRWILQDPLFIKNNLDVSNNVNISGDLVVDGSFDLSGRIDVTNDASFNGNVDISNHLTVEGDASFNGNVDISGKLNADNILLGELLKGIGRFILIDTSGNLVDSSFIIFDGSNVIIDTSAGLKIPAGTTNERPNPPLQGHIRYNSTLDSFEGYNGINWGKLGGLRDVDGDTFISVENTSGEDNDDLDFFTGGIRYLQIDNSGNILIGKGNNLSKFTISGETGDTQIAGTVEISGNSGGIGLTVHNDISINNIYMNEFLYGPEVMYIDPVHPTSDNSGLLVLRADLQVLGTQTTINSTTTEVSHNIIVHIPAALTNGGLKVKDQNNDLRPFVFKNAPDFRWDLSDAIIFRDDASFSSNIDISENLYVNGDVSFQRNLDVSGRLTTTNFTVKGDVSFNGNVDISDRLVTYGDISLNSQVDISGKLNVYDSATFLGDGQGLVVVNDSSMNGDLYLAGVLYTEHNFIIDPKGHGDNTGLVIIKGGLQVDGSSTVINSTVLDISDHRILLSSNSTHQSQTDGAGIEVSNNKLFIYDYANDRWLTNIGLNVSGDLIVEEDTSLNNAVTIGGKFNINGDTSFNAPVTITGKFNVTGDTSMNGKLEVTDDVSLGNRLDVYGDVSLNGKLDVSNQLNVNGDASFSNNVDISENLYVNGDVSFQRNLDVSGTFMATTLKVLGDVSFDGFVDISDRLVVNGDASFNQDVEIAGTLNTGATDISDTLNVEGDVSLNSSVTISDELIVNGDVSLNSNVDISHQLNVNGDVSLNGNVDISEKLIVNGDVSLNSNLDISDNLVVNGDASFNSDVEISGILFVNDMVVDGDVSFNSNVDVSDRLLVNGDVSLNSNVDISDSLVVNGDASFNSHVEIADTLNTGATDISDTLNVDGDVSLNSSVTISNELIVNGDVSLNSNVDISKNLYVNGDVSFQRNLDVSGQIIATSIKVLDDVSFNGNVDISDRLLVNGDISLNSNVDISNRLVVNGDASFNEDVEITGTLNTGATDISNTLNVDGDVSLNSSVTISNELIVNGDVSLNSNVDISKNLYVNGDVSFQRNLDVSGKLVVTTLEVLGDVSFNKNVDISDRLVVYGDVSFQSTLTIEKNLTVSGETILSTLRVNDLSNNRVVIVGPSGELEDDENFTFDGSNLVIDTSQAIQIPVGTTNERPSSVTGQIRFNVTDNRYEGYNGNAWVPLGDSGNNLIVATGTGTNTLNWSNDHGETWNPVTDSNTLFAQAEDIAWNGRRWVAVGAQGGRSQIVCSDDGIIWFDASNSSSLFNAQADAIGANNYLWIAGGSFQANNIIYSLDGIYWSYANNSPFALICNDVKYGGNLWVAAGGYAVTSPNYVLGYSLNGKDWFGTARGDIFSTQANAIAWNGELWVAVGGGSSTPFTIAYSYNGKNWIGVAGSTSLIENGHNVAWNGSLFVIVGESSIGAPNTILTSQDGINWTGRGKSVFGTGVNIGRGRGITWSGSNWIAVGFNSGSPSNTIATSLDGINWIGKGSTNFSIRGTGVAVNNLFDYNKYQLETLDISYRNVDISLNLIVEGNTLLNKNVDISENLYVNGDVSFQRNLDVSGQIVATSINVLGDVSFDGFVDICNRLVIYGDASFNQDVEISGSLNTGATDISDTLNVDGDVSLNSSVNIRHKLNVDGDVSLNSKVDISNQVNINGDVSLNKNVDISGNLYVNGDVSFQRNLDVSGELIITSLKVLGDVSFDGFVDISDRLVVYGDGSFNKNIEIAGTLNTGATDISDTLNVDGDVSLNSSVTIKHNLIVNRDVSLNSNIDISENLYVNGDVSFQRNLDVSGLSTLSTLKVLGDVSFNKNVDISDNLLVNGDALFNQDVTISGILYGNKVIISNDASFNSYVEFNRDVSFNSNVDISSNLYVNGDVSFQRNLDVSGLLTLTRLEVLGDVSFNGNVDISDKLVTNGDASFNKDVNISGTLNGYKLIINDDSSFVGHTYFNSDVSMNSNLTIDKNLTVDGNTILSTLRVNDLTHTRIVFIGSSGELIDSSFLSFDGSNLIIDTSSSIQIPVGTTSERPLSAIQGQIRFNITDNTYEGYDGNNWGSLGGVKDVDGDTFIRPESNPGADNDELEFFAAGTKHLVIDGCGNIIVGSNMFTISAETGYTCIAGDVSLNNNVDISENLYVNGDVSFQRNLDVSGQLVASSLKVLGDVSFNGNVDISDRLVVYGDISLNGNVDISDRLVVNGDALLNSNVDICNRLQVEGDVSLNGNVDICNRLLLYGDASFNSNVDILNRLNVNNIAFDGLRKDINVLNGENNLLVAVGKDEITNSNSIIYSHDLGDTWVSVSGSRSIFSDTSIGGSGVEFNGSLWVASGRGTNHVAYSYDGINWNAGGTISNHSGRAVKYDNYRGRWILGLQGSTTLAYSYNGINWVSLGNDSISSKVMGIDLNSSLYVATGEGINTLVYSYDLNDWEAISPNPYQRGRCILWSGRRWFAGGSIGTGESSLLYSDDGINWIDVSNANNLAESSKSIFSTVVNKIASNGSTVVAVGKGINTIAYSKDHGESFTGLGTLYLTQEGYAVEWCGTHFIVGGTGNEMFKSTDGINWTAIETPGICANDIAWNKSIYGTLPVMAERLTLLENNIDVSFRNVDISLDLLVEGRVTIVGDVSLNQNVDISNNLQVLGDALLNDKVTIGNHLQLLGDASLNNKVDISDNLYVNGDVSFQRNLDVSGTLTTTKFIVKGDVSFNANVDISENLNVIGDVSFQKNLDITNNVNVGQNFEVNGTSILHGGVTLNSTLDVSNTARFAGSDKGVIIENDLSVNNYIYMGSHLYGPPILYIDPVHPSADNSGLLVIRADLQVLGTQTTINSIITEVSSNIIVHIPSALSEGGLQVKDERDILHGFVFKNSPDYRWDLSDSILFRSDASFDHDVDICGTLHVNNMIVNGDISLNGFVDISENLYVNGDASFQRALDVSGLLTGSDISCDNFRATRFKALINGELAIGISAGLDNQGQDSIAIGNAAGNKNQGKNAIGIGIYAGITNQGLDAIAIGNSSGGTLQGDDSIAIGNLAGNNNQQTRSISIGYGAGEDNQGSQGIAIGYDAGKVDQSSNSIAIGNQAGKTNQGTDSIAIGRLAGLSNQGDNAIAIGAISSVTSQKENTIIISASGSHNATDFSNALYINPIRNADNSFLLQYDSTTKEITYSRTLNIEKLDVIDLSVINLDVSYRLLVEGDASFNKKVDISGQLEVFNDASFNGKVDISNKLNVTGDSSFNGNLDISYNLTVNGDASFNQDLEVTGSLNAGATDISDSLNVNGDVSLNSSVTISDELIVNGDVSLNSNVDILNRLNVNGEVLFERNLDISLNLLVEGNSVINGNVDISENLYVNGDVSFQRNLDVSGKLFATTFEAMDVSFRNVDVSGVLNVLSIDLCSNFSNAIEVDNLIIGEIIGDSDWRGIKRKDVPNNQYALIHHHNGHTVINGSDVNFKVSDKQMIRLNANQTIGIGTNMVNTSGYDVGISGNVLLNSDVKVIGDVSFEKNLDISENLYVNGDVSFQRNLDVSGKLFATKFEAIDVSFRNVDISNRLFVEGDSSFNNFVDISNLRVGHGYGKSNGDPSSKLSSASQTILGNLQVGYIGYDDWAGIRHNNLTTTGQYALIQNNAGTTILNAGNGQNINFNIGNGVKMRLAANGNFGIGELNPDSTLELNGDSSFNGKVDISDKLNVLGDSSFNRNLDISDNLTVNGDVSFQRNLDVIEKLTATSIKVLNSVDISENLYVNGDVSFQRNLDISGKLVASSLKVLDDVSFDGFVDICNRLVVKGDASFNKNVEITKTLSVGDVNISDILNVIGDVSLNSNVNIGNKLDVYGDVSINSNLEVSKNLSVNGDVSLNSNIDISENLYVNGDVSFQRNLDVSGKLFSSVLEALDVSFRNVDISNKIIVQGDANFNSYVEASNLLVGGVINAAGFTGIKHKDVVSNLGYSLIQNSDGKTIINSLSPETLEFRTSGSLMGIFRDSKLGIGENFPTSLLTVGGDSSLNGDVTIAENLQVLGDVSFQKNLDISNNLYVNGDVSFQRNLDVSNHMVVNGTRFSSIKHVSDVIDCKTNFMVAIGGGSGEGNNKLAYSYDGINWTGVVNSTSLFTSFGEDVETNGTTWVAVGNGTNSLAYSYDGKTWVGLGTTIDGLNINRGFVVKWINKLGKYYFGCHGGRQFAYSYDGIDWSWVNPSSGVFGVKITGFDYNNNRFVAVGEGTSDTLAYSDDGITWTLLGNSLLTKGTSVAYNDKLWIATGEGACSIIYSEDNGVNWVDASNANDLTQGSASIFTTRVNQVAFNGYMWVAVGGGSNSIAYSYDGKNWTGLGIVSLAEGKGITWVGTKWIAIGNIGRICYSYNGIDWLNIPNGANIFSSFGAKVGWKKNVYPSLGEINNRINDISSVLTGGSYAAQVDLEDLSQTVLDLSTNYYEFKSDFIDLSLTVQDLSENLLRNYEDASFGTVEIRDNLILTDLSVTNLDVANRFLVAPNTDISAVIGRAQIGHVGYNGWAGFKNENLIENNQYALLQSSAGKTLLNADAVQDLRLRLDNLDYVVLKSNMITIGRLSTTNYNVVLNADVSMVTNASIEGDFSVNRIESDLIPKVDNTYSLGSISNEWKDLFVGGGSIYMDKTRIIHRNSGDTLIIDNSSLSVDFSDILHVNFRPDVSFNGIVEVSGSLIANNMVVDNLDILDVSFRNVDISDRLFVEGDSSFNNYVDISNLTVGANKTHSTTYLGNAAIGFIGNNDNNINHALYGHKDYYNQNSGYALKQNNDGTTHLNAVAGTHITFRVANTAKARLLSSGDFGIGLTDPIGRLHISGGGIIAEEDSSFNKNLMISGEIITSSGYGGISGEILTSTGSGWKWNTMMLNDLSDVIVDITDFSNSIKIGSNKTGTLNNAHSNVFIGWESGGNVTNGIENTGLGFHSLNALAGGDSNTALGKNTLKKLVSGNANVAVGNNTLQNNLNGGYNTGFGSGCLKSLTTGDNNVGFGRNAGDGIIEGDNNIFIGYQAIPGKDISDSQNQMVIGYDVSGKGSNTILLGNNNITDTYLQGRVDIKDICGEVVVHDLATVNDSSTKIATTGAIRRYIKTALPIYNTGSITTDQKLNSKLCLSFPRDNRIVIKESDIYSDLDYKTSGAQEFTFGQSCDDLYVTVGAGSAGQIAYSYDGYSWNISPNTTLFSARGYGVDYNGLLYVAVGQGAANSLIVSLDGINWEGYGKTIFTTRGYVVRYENGIWVAGGEGTNTLAYSFNGQTWEICTNSDGGLASTIFDTNCRGIAYNGLIWVACGSGSLHTLAYSLDGISWTGLGKTAISSNGFCVESNGEVFLAGGQGGNKLVRSNNGVNWTAVNVGMTIKVQSIACNGKTWVIGGNGINFLAYSVDNGYTFTNISQTIFNGFINSLYWSGRHFFASGEGTNTMGISRDGINWKVLSGSPFDSKGGGVVLNNRKRNVIKFEKKMSILCGEGTNTLMYETLTYDISNIGITYTGISGSTDIFSTRARRVAHDGKMWVAAGVGTNYSLAYSDNGTTWHGIPHSKTRLFTLGAEGIAYNGSMWVAAGQNDVGADTSNVTIAYSYDGLCWIPVIDSISLVNQGFCVVWGEDIWLVGGYANSVMAYSYDGKNWAGVPDKRISTNVQDIAWNGKNFIAVGNGSSNTIAISSNGLNWRGCGNSIFSNVGRGVAWSEKLKIWVAVGNGTNTIGYSYNGLNWEVSGNSTNIFTTLGRGVYYNGVRFVALGQGTNSVAYSDDGINWTGLTGLKGFETEGWDGGRTNQYGCVNIVNPIVAVGEDSDKSTIAYSMDGINWSVIGKHIFQNNGWYVAYNGSIWVAVGDGNQDSMAYSYDGMNWVGLGKTIFTTRGLGLGWNGSYWVAGGRGTNQLAISYDGINWSGVSQTVFTTQVRKLCWTGTQWIALGEGTNRIGTSPDGINWTGRGNGLFNSGGAIDVASNGLIHVGVGDGASHRITYSYDGITWNAGQTSNGSSTSTLFTTEVYAVATNGKMWVVAGRGGNTMGYSYDGITWYGSGQPIAQRGYGVCWNGRYWVAVGRGSPKVIISYDGINWLAMPNPGSVPFHLQGLGVNSLVRVINEGGYNKELVLGKYWHGLSNTMVVHGPRYYADYETEGYNSFNLTVRGVKDDE